MKRTTWRTVIAGVVGCVVFLGVPVVSWGLGDVRGFFAHPARVGYCVVAAVGVAVALATLPEGGRGSREGKKTVGRQRIALVLLQLLSLGTVIVGPWADGRGIGVLPWGDAGRYAGLGLFAVGYGLMLWAVAALGRQFSVQVTIQEGHQLVTSGPYRLVRHPRYAGVLAFLAGYSLIFLSWVGLCLAAGTAVVLAWRIHDEEALMREEFGVEWERYVKRSRRLIPFVY